MIIECPKCKAEMDLLNHMDNICPNGHRFIWGKIAKEASDGPEPLRR